MKSIFTAFVLMLVLGGVGQCPIAPDIVSDSSNLCGVRPADSNTDAKVQAFITKSETLPVAPASDAITQTTTTESQA